MGLDNGVNVRRTPITDKIPVLEVLNLDGRWDKDKRYDFSMAYFRKCWNVRADIFDFGIGYNQKEHILTKENVEQIADLLESYNEDKWEDSDGSIWTFEEMEPHLDQYVENLRILSQLMDKYELEVYFYDSY